MSNNQLEEFRAEVRQWLDANCPQSLRTPLTEDQIVWGGSHVEFQSDDQKIWFERMRDKGWFAPDWPKEFGGGGLNPDENRVLEQEMRKLRCRVPQINLGIWMLGPVVLEFGTEEQKKEFLLPMTQGKVRWCQGFSEPNAGSDLASLKTTAVLDGDDFIINGSKIWTSHGNHSDCIYMLVRTDPAASKQEGISFVVLDLKLPGVNIKPIEMISGASHFCQIFFDQVRIPKRNLIGPLNGGWTVAKRLLQFERKAMSKFDDGGAPDFDYLSLVKRYLQGAEGAHVTSALKSSIVSGLMADHAYKLTTRRAFEEGRAGMNVSGLASSFKYISAELEKKRLEDVLNMMGYRGLGWDNEGGHEEFTEEELAFTNRWLISKTIAIAGGTSEIQLNIISKRVLGLPDWEAK